MKLPSPCMIFAPLSCGKEDNAVERNHLSCCSLLNYKGSFSIFLFRCCDCVVGIVFTPSLCGSLVCHQGKMCLRSIKIALSQLCKILHLPTSQHQICFQHRGKPLKYLFTFEN